MTSPETQHPRLSASRRAGAAAWAVVLLVLGVTLGLDTALGVPVHYADGAQRPGTVRMNSDPRPRSAIQQRAPVTPVADRTGPATDPSGPPRSNPKQAALAPGADAAHPQTGAHTFLEQPAPAHRQAGLTTAAPRGPPAAA